MRNVQLRQVQVFVAISEARLHQITYDVLSSKVTFCESVLEFFNTDDPNLQHNLDSVAKAFLIEYIKLITSKPRSSELIQIIRKEILVCLKSRLHMNTGVNLLAGFSYKKFIDHYPQALLDKKILETSHDCMDAIRERIGSQYDAMSTT